MNNDFWSWVRWFANNFHEWRSHEWKSLANRISYSNILCPEHTGSAENISSRNEIEIENTFVKYFHLPYLSGVNELIAKHLEGSEHSLWEEYKQGDHVVITLSS